MFFFDEKPSNLGDTGKDTRVIGGTGQRSAPFAGGTKEKGEHVTLACGVRGDGIALPVLHVFAGSRVKAAELEGAPDFALHMKTETSNSSVIVMKNFVDRCILPNRVDPTGYVVLFLDQFASHVDLEFLEHCVANKVCVLGGIPHSTDKTALLDVAVFGPFERAINERTRNFYQENPYGVLNHGGYMAITTAAWSEVATIDLIVKGCTSLGYTCPPTLGTKLAPKIVERSAKAAAVMQVPAGGLNLRLRTAPGSAVTAPTAAADPILSAANILNPNIPLPPSVPASWPREDMYYTLVAMRVLYARQLAAEVRERQSVTRSGATVDGRAAALTSAERMAAVREAEDEKIKAAALQQANREERESRRTHTCPHCHRKYAAAASLKSHIKAKHDESTGIVRAPSNGAVPVPDDDDGA